MADIDYSGAQTLGQIQAELTEHHVRFVIAEALDAVRAELERYGLVDLLGEDAFYPTVTDAVDAFRHSAN